MTETSDTPFPPGDPYLEAAIERCSVCGASLDVSEADPLTQIDCPRCSSPLTVSPNIGRYRLIEVAGRGGMGAVYKAEDTVLGRHVALKVLRRDRLSHEALAQLETEAAVTASINHPNVVRVFNTGAENGRFFISMEFVGGGTLESLMEREGRLDEARALGIGIQIATGLRAAQQRGLIHRDVKPANVLFLDGTAKIVDFGLAVVEAEAVGSGEIWGTPYYVAPEKLDEKPEDFRSDIYSLGATLFHAIAGRPLFEAPDASLVALKHLKSQAVSISTFAPWISKASAFVVNRMLAKSPEGRFGSYDELIEHLTYARTSLQQQSQQEKQVSQQGKLRNKLPQVQTKHLAAGAAVLLLVALITVFFAHRSEASKKRTASAFRAVPPEIAERIRQSRQALLFRNGASTAKAFHELANDPAVPEPESQWCAVNEALSCFIRDDAENGEKALAQLSKLHITNLSPEGKALETAFGHMARLGSTSSPIPADAAREFDKSGPGLMGLLVIGLKDLALRDLDDARIYLEQFANAVPNPAQMWMSEYREAPAAFVTDYTAYKNAAAKLRLAKHEQELRTALEELRSVRKRCTKAVAELIDLQLAQAPGEVAPENRASG